MTEKDLEKIFAEVDAEVYSSEHRKKIEEQVKKNTGLDDEGVAGLTLAIRVNRELDKNFLFRVLARTLCDK